MQTTGTSSMEPSPAIERVEDLWFNDADVNFQAENKKVRLYRDIMGSVGLCNLPLVRIGNSHLGVAESSFV